MNRLIPYTGNKYKYLDLIIPIIKSFDKTKVFIDAFGGSGSIALNVNFKKIILNEYEPSIFAIYNSFKFGDFNLLQNLITNYDLKNKNSYYEFRNFVNTLDKNSIEYGFGIFWLIKSCINNLSRFNSKGHFNQAFGNRFCQIEIDEFNKLKQKFSDIVITNLDFFNLKIQNRIIFLDPPYSKTTVGYGQIDENKILDLVKKLSIDNDVILTYDVLFPEFENFIELRQMSTVNPNSKKIKTNSEYLMWNFKNMKETQ